MRYLLCLITLAKIVRPFELCNTLRNFLQKKTIFGEMAEDYFADMRIFFNKKM